MKVTHGGTQMGTPRWAGDFRGRDQLMPFPARLDPTQFFALNSVVVTVGAAGAAQGATAIPVDALSGAIPNGTVLHFGGTKFAVLMAEAAAGATSLAVSALPTALVDDDTARYAGTGLISVPSGTPIGRTIAERDAGSGWGPADLNDDEVYLMAFDVTDASKNPDVELYRHNKAVKENFLPGWTGMSTDMKDLIRSLYACYVGAE